MKAMRKTVGALLVCLIPASCLVARIIGFEPHGGTPGLWLKGDLVTAPVADWSLHGQISDRHDSDSDVVSASSFGDDELCGLQRPALLDIILSGRGGISAWQELERERGARPARTHKNWRPTV